MNGVDSPPALVKLGDPRLRQVCREVDLAASAGRSVLDALVDIMAAVMVECGGAAIAAPQVGVDSRVVVYNREAFGADDWDAFGGAGLPVVAHLNPACARGDGRPSLDFEACLSIPRIAAVVPRAGNVRYRATCRDGRTVSTRLQGRAARIAQHETDHLDGVLFIDVADSRGFMTAGSVTRLYEGDVQLAVERLGIGRP